MRDKIMSAARAKAMRAEAGRSGGGWFSPTDVLTSSMPDTWTTWRRRGAEGDLLIVGLNSDASVRRIKGDKRPIVKFADRSAALAGLMAVDAVVEFDEDTPLHLINELEPDVLVKGADWAEADIVGAREVKAGAAGWRGSP